MTALRRALSLVWLSLALTVLVLVGLSHAAPALGFRLVVIAGPSMSPAIPLGAVVLERTVPVSAIAVGDVVTVQMSSGVAITHRTVRIGDIRGEVYLETRGDANDSSDPTVVPASAVTGVVALALPVVGFLLAYLAVPSGVASIILTLAALMFAIWTLEELAPRGVHERDHNTRGVDTVDGLPA